MGRVQCTCLGGNARRTDRSARPAWRPRAPAPRPPARRPAAARRTAHVGEQEQNQHVERGMCQKCTGSPCKTPRCCRRYCCGPAAAAAAAACAAGVAPCEPLSSTCASLRSRRQAAPSSRSAWIGASVCTERGRCTGKRLDRGLIASGTIEVCCRPCKSVVQLLICEIVSQVHPCDLGGCTYLRLLHLPLLLAPRLVLQAALLQPLDRGALLVCARG